MRLLLPAGRNSTAAAATATAVVHTNGHAVGGDSTQVKTTENNAQKEDSAQHSEAVENASAISKKNEQEKEEDKGIGENGAQTVSENQTYWYSPTKVCMETCKRILFF